jgi:hypothetical protein
MPNPPDGPGFEFLTLDSNNEIAKQQLHDARTQGWQVDSVYFDPILGRVAVLEYGYTIYKKAARK